MPKRQNPAMYANPIAMDKPLRPVSVGHMPETRLRQVTATIANRARQKIAVVRGVASAKAPRMMDLCALSELLSNTAQTENKPNVTAHTADTLTAVPHSLIRRN